MLAGEIDYYQLEKRYIDKRGQALWGHLTSSVVRDGDGKPLYFISQTQNITERKRAEEALRESEERYRTSVETMLDAFAILSAIRDDTGRIVDFRYEYINEAACQLNQRTREEQIGHTLQELLPAHKETGLIDEYARVVETGEPLAKDSLLYEDTYGQGQRRARSFDIRVTKLGDGIVASWRDITERKRAEEALRESEERYRNLVEN